MASLMNMTTDPQMLALLKNLFVEHWKEKPVKFEFEKNIANQTIIIGGEMENGDLKTLEVTYDFIMDNAVHAGTKFKVAKSPFKKKKGTQPMDVFARAAFDEPDQNAFHFSIQNHGKLMPSLFSGTCALCNLNIPKGVTIVYGSDHPSKEPAAFHPACFVRAQNPDNAGRYLRAMPRSLDEMRWRRRSKGLCHNESVGGSDPTIPESHHWRCACSNAPWNLTKRMREAKRKQLQVGKYDPPF